MNHDEALERVQDQIIEHFSTDDPVEQQKLEGIADIGMEVAGFLQSKVADDHTSVDTGYGCGQYDCHVTVGGREYHVAVTAGHTKAEMQAWHEALGKSEDEVVNLEKRVLEALRVAGHYGLATEFEALIDVSSICASVDTLPEGRDTK